MELNFDKMNGLVPAIIQDNYTQKVLMLGSINEEAYQKTVETGKVTFFSRTKNRLWTKGEESGNFLNVVSIKADCDDDTLLIMVNPVGMCATLVQTLAGAKRTNRISCSLKNFRILSTSVTKKCRKNHTLQACLSPVSINDKKVGEEAVETIIEACNGTDERLIYEGADLIYHLIVLLTSKGYRIEDLARELKERHSETWKKH